MLVTTAISSAVTVAVLLFPNVAHTTEQMQPVVSVQQGRAWMQQNPKLGGVGPYKDSNVPDVWKSVPKWIRELGLCIRKHESINAGHYKAHNGSSSASGAYQFIDATWQGNAYWTKVSGEFVARKYEAANHAPAWVQDAVFIHSIRKGGFSNWLGTNCPGT